MLRTRIGFDTIITQVVESIELADVVRAEVLAPYQPPTPRLALIIFGLSFGMMIGSQFQPGASLVIAAVAVTFGIVATVVGGTTSAGQRLLRLKMAQGTPWIVTYRVEDEEEVKGLFGEERWADENRAGATTPLKPDEELQAERMRYGTLLAAGSCSIITLMFAVTNADVSDAVAIPVNILYLAVLGLALMFSGIAWFKMTRARIRK